MKQFPFRRKTLLRALRAAALAFLCWIGAQRAAQAQTVIPGGGGYSNVASDSYLVDSGTTVATAAAGGNGSSNGQSASPYGTVILGAGTLSNYGTVSFTHAETNSANAAAVVMGSTGSAYVHNHGTISLSAPGSGLGTAGSGLFLLTGSPGSLTVVNESGAVISGSVTGSFRATGIGLSANSTSGAVTITNRGTMSGYAQSSGSAYAAGISAVTTSGVSQIVNTGDISASSIGGGSRNGTKGVIAGSTSGSSDVTNHGTIEAAGTSTGSGYTSVDGIYNEMDGLGAGSASNTGLITARGIGSSSNVYGISVVQRGLAAGTITVDNSGRVDVSGTSCAGLDAEDDTDNAGKIQMTNSGMVTCASSGSAYGLNVRPGNGTIACVLNSGTVIAGTTGTLSAYGIIIAPVFGAPSPSGITASVTNTGTVTATGTNSYGIYLGMPGTVTNSGDVSGGKAAISVPSGSTVTLAGTGVVNGLIVGGTGAGSASTLNFNLNVSSAVYAATQRDLNAVIAADGYRTGIASVVINGHTYQFQYFGTVADGLVSVDFGQVAAATFGNSSLGMVLNALSANSTDPRAASLLTALGGVPAAGLPAAVAQLSPAKVSQQLTTQPFHQAIFQDMALGSRLTQVRQNFGGGMDTSGFQFAGSDPLLGQITSRLYAYNPTHSDTVGDTPHALSSEEQFNRWGTFLTGNAVLVNQSATASQSHVDSTTVDLTAGADYRIDKNWAVGFLFGYGKTAAAVDGFGSRVTDDQYRLGPYVGYNDGPWYANASGYFAFNDQSSKRAIPFLGETAQANPFGTQYGAAADGGYEFKALDKKLTFGPTGGLQYTHLDIDPYAESGSAADLRVEAQHADSLISSLGGKADYDLHWKWNNATVRPEVHASWLHEFMGNSDTVGAAFDVPGSAGFTVASQRQQRDSALVGGGVQNIFPGGSLLYLDYDAQVGIDNYLAQSITGGFKVVF